MPKTKRKPVRFTMTRSELDKLVFGAAIAVCDYPTATWRNSVQYVVDKYAAAAGGVAPAGRKTK